MEKEYPINVKVIADSITPWGKRITTVEWEYPRYIHCFDSETEILSQINEEAPEFRSFAAVKELGAKVAQFDEDNGSISFVEPLTHVKNSGNFKMVSLESGEKFPMLVTDKHRVHTLRRSTGNVYLNSTILAEELVQGKFGARRILQSGYFETEQSITNAELEFVAWFVADGHSPIGGNLANFHFKKQRKIDEVQRVLNDCGFDFTVSTYEDDVVIRFSKNYLTEECYDENRVKIIPAIAMKQSVEGWKKFKNALLLSDGNLATASYNTTSVKLMNQIQVLAHLHCDSINIKKYGDLCKSTFKDSNYISIRQDKDKFEFVDYEGDVFCVTVPTSYVMVRRKGIVFISGNCEIMTHRVFSRNAQSSRAVPVDKTLEVNAQKPVEPLVWGKNKAGMSSSEVLEGDDLDDAKRVWRGIAASCFSNSRYLAQRGLHKQWSNRITEPFSTIKVIVTATEWDNFFWLRDDPDAAQPEIVELARKTKKAFEDSIPVVLLPGEWHLPYVDYVWSFDYDKAPENDEVKREQAFQDSEGNLLTLEDALKISASCCAQVSYRKLDETKEKAIEIYERLFSGPKPHLSPVEHQAQVVTIDTDWPNGVTHVDKYGKFWSGNFQGWIQYRQLLQSSLPNT